MSMKIVSYFDFQEQGALAEKIARCDWSAARFLVELLTKNTFYETLGGWGELYLLLDGETLVSFATFTGQDAVRDESLTPWIGFVYTDPAYRGHRYAGRVLAKAEAAAASRGYSRIYIATDHVGLYEKYGYAYQENRIDCWGSDLRVLFKDLEKADKHGLNIHARRFREEDAAEVSALIAKTLRTTNIADYSPEYIEKDVAQFTPQNVIQRAGWTHFYVFCDAERIVGCGAIGPYWGKEDESSLFNIFVLPEYQGKGVGKKIIATLEEDAYALRAKRIEIPASITACGFYRKMGYNYKNGIDTVDEEQLYRLEKYTATP